MLPKLSLTAEESSVSSSVVVYDTKREGGSAKKRAQESKNSGEGRGKERRSLTMGLNRKADDSVGVLG